MKKLMSSLLALVMLVSVFFPAGVLATQTQTEEDVDVVVHKILMNKTDLDAHDKNKTYKPADGIANITDFFGASAKEIDGVYFVAIKEGEAGYDNFDETTVTKEEWAAKEAAGTAGLTEDGGKLTLKLKSPGKYKIYEVKSKTTYKGADGKLLAETKAVPVELTLPDHAMTETGLASTIHVYPKNTEDGPSVDKWVIKDGEDKKEASFDKDEEHTWAIEAPIPTKFEDYKIFNLVDKLQDSLTYVQGQTVSVKVKGKDKITLTKDTDYTITEPTGDGGTLTVSFTEAGIQKLAKEAAVGDIVRVEFKSTINDKAVMSKDIPNDVTLEYGHNPDNKQEKKPGENPRVYTGGKKFKKIDSKDKKALKEAKFVVKNTKGEYLLEKDGKYSWAKVADEGAKALLANEDVKKITSGEDGTFEIKGLEYAPRDTGTKYFLKEVQAPEGYAIKNEEIEFIVNDTSYYADAEKVTPADPQNVDNAVITIPQTGGMGTIVFGLVGIAVMAGAFIAIRKRSVQAN